ncbi:MAG: hypothetical protein IPK17_17990 [Chloroflexi bacterium]|uniref:amino acid--tRNA ligase-related protein n=1 Tax=Candidatus Flexifilum breve TaxID=3140694 RepID=UPI003136030F|nr:hypothetical protein [Chloroflexota bacterium]
MQSLALGNPHNRFVRRAQELIELGIQVPTKYFARSQTLFEVNENYEYVQLNEAIPVEGLAVCGRVMSITEQAGYVLVTIEDQDARLQLGLALNRLSKRLALLRTHVFRGDYLGFDISAITRIDGRLTGLSDSWCFLALTYCELPDTPDPEVQYRHRSLSMAAYIDLRERWIKRSKILYQTRQFLQEAEILEVNAPSFRQCEIGAPVSLDNSLRALVTGGIEQVYEFHTNCNTGTVDRLNHPQSLQLTCWMALKTPEDAMHLVETLINHLAHKFHSTDLIQWLPFERLSTSPQVDLKTVYEDPYVELDLSPHWARRTVAQLMVDIWCIDFTTLATVEDAVNAVVQAGLNLWFSRMGLCRGCHDRRL